MTLVFRDVRLDAGGLGVDVRDIANGLAMRGHRVRVLTSVADPDGLGFAPDVQVEVLPSLFPKRLSETYGLNARVYSSLARSGRGIVHVVSCVPVYLHLAAMMAARLAGQRLVWTPMMHPARRFVWREYSVRGAAMQAFDATVPRAARFAHAVAAATLAEAVEFRRLRCPRVEVLPPGVHPAGPRSIVGARAVRERFGLGAGPLVMTVAARAERRKGLDFGLATVDLVRRRIPELQFVVAGSAGAHLAERAGVHPLGRVSDDELSLLYRASDVTFVPSSYEAFSRVVIEAWQQERPVVVTDRVGLAERVAHERGAVVRYGDPDSASQAIAGLVGDSAMAHAYGLAGRALVESEYLVPRIVERAERLYLELLGD